MGRHSKGRRQRVGLSLVEMLIAIGIAVVAAAIIIQVFVLTMRTTDQTSSQADTQQSARSALANIEGQMRDAWAIVSSYSPPALPGTQYVTQVTGTEQTIVAALPSVDAAGQPCAWRGINLIYDCLVWQAARGADGTWSLTRRIFTNAFQMPASYFVRRGTGAPAGPFFSVLLAQTPEPEVPYTVPAGFLRDREAGPMTLFTGASVYTVELWSAGGLLAPRNGTTSPPAASTGRALPLTLDAVGNRTNTPAPVTNAATVKLSLQFTRSAAALATGQGEVIQSDTQSASIDLRNRGVW